jgi:hypothetical protein
MEIGGQRNYTCTIHSTLLERGKRYVRGREVHVQYRDRGGKRKVKKWMQLLTGAE